MNLQNVDVDAVQSELERFVSEASPVSASGNGFITSRSNPRCGRQQAIDLAERVRPILDALYSDWRLENPPRKTFEFSGERDASMRLLARLKSYEEVQSMLGSSSLAPSLSAAALHDQVWSAASTQWSTSHRHEAVLAAAKAVNSLLQSKTGRRDLSEGQLIREAFSDKPRLRFVGVQDHQTRESLRQGVMQFGTGCFAAIRNPVSHLPNEAIDLPEQLALERLASLSLLARWIDEAEIEVADSETEPPAEPVEPRSAPS
jgi:uncharacterized protein (TIGR02391 family)